MNNNTNSAKQLFEEIKVKRGLKECISNDLDDRALAQWKSKHDYIPTLEEIDAVIEEVRNEKQ